ncbi:MAG: hypothetical protein NTY86_18475 [Deltaproteobacteria bacterium]|nr:hypothetical protein [Deltaproteobacteria bacterium]
MSNLVLLKDLLNTVQYLKKELTGYDAEKVNVAQEVYQELLDGFYEEHQDTMSPQQYKAAKDDPDYFLVLIKLACCHEEKENVDKQGGQSLSYFNWKLFTEI